MMRTVSVARARALVTSSFWLIPATAAVASVGVAIALIALDDALPSLHAAYLYPGPPSGARSMLSSITTAMISFTGVVFSVTIVVLQLTSGQFSPRALRMFLGDRTIQLTMGVFVATFIYALIVQRAVTGGDGSGAGVPRIAVTGALLLVLVSVGLFIRYIDRVANLVRVATIIADVGADSRRLLECTYPQTPSPRAAPVLPPATGTLETTAAGVLVSLDERALAKLAERNRCVINVIPRVGDYLVHGAALLTVHGPANGARQVLSSASRLAAFDSERSFEQDLAFGFRQLIDIAERALSPAVNDPTTACQALDVLHDLLRRLATRPSPSSVVQGPGGMAALIVPRHEFGDLLVLTVSEIWHYGHTAAQVPARLRRMLDDLDTVAIDPHQVAVYDARSLLAGPPGPA